MWVSQTQFKCEPVGMLSKGEAPLGRATHTLPLPSPPVTFLKPLVVLGGLGCFYS